jgi:DNA-directed RNA polymerase specialized sigma24 family protein
MTAPRATTLDETNKEGGRRAAVYRLYDAEGVLLYIGSAYDPKGRAKAHRAKPWWPLVARREDEWHPSREAAYVAETEAIRAVHPQGNKISGPGAVAAPAPKPRVATPVFALAEVDAYFELLEAEPPAIRFRKLTEFMEVLDAAYRAERKDIFRRMRADGMTYREIGDAVGLSFGRVRQILAEDLEADEKQAEE